MYLVRPRTDQSRHRRQERRALQHLDTFRNRRLQDKINSLLNPLPNIFRIICNNNNSNLCSLNNIKCKCNSLILNKVEVVATPGVRCLLCMMIL